MCTAVRSGTCDQRERGVRHLTAVRRDPKKKRKVVCFKAEARERGALPRRRRARRCCFRSVYFRAPGGVLFPTILADDSRFTVDEPKETLGNAIKLPPWYESRRAEIVTALPPLR